MTVGKTIRDEYFEIAKFSKKNGIFELKYTNLLKLLKIYAEFGFFDMHLDSTTNLSTIKGIICNFDKSELECNSELHKRLVSDGFTVKYGWSGMNIYWALTAKDSPEQMQDIANQNLLDSS